MSDSARQWIQGCAVGCGALVLFSIFALVGFTVSMRSVFVDAKADRKVLEETFGKAAAYTPPVDGAVSPDRVEAFLDVRDAVGEVVVAVIEVDGEMGDFEDLAEDDDAPMRVALPAVVRLTSSMMRLPKIFGEVEKTRNRALRDAGMGLGEYTYIYAMCYRDQLLDSDSRVYLLGASAANDRVREELRGMVRRQLAAAEESPDVDDEWVAVLAAEVEVLEADHDRIPWQDGMPATIAASFDAYRERLDDAYSPEAAELDLANSIVKNGGLQITMD